ncbi:methylated-DNA/protein-cysteinemethyltransferase [Segniliparus rotundus DSM 44985]|uniref:Methylated-DNA--protein-cysteine methyltransferase n=2 Tax=Segniliparus rotundus TaxID=286802 RepID=D6Z838_SEGRD|nr:methylated-DNA/protein-cysteinemethyltransferase [Segniliparus rotundus DSM 44985]
MSTTTSAARHVVVEFFLGTLAIGPLTLVRDEEGLTGIFFPGHWTRPDESSFGARTDPARDDSFNEAIAQLREYFAGSRREFDLELRPRGSQLAQRVWRRLAQVPFGQTTTYGALAKEIGGGISPRAIGGFVGHNPVSIIIPCHRVLGSTGGLTGYAGGLDRKRALLEHEGALLPAEAMLW